MATDGYTTLLNNLFGSSFSDLLGGTASLPRIQSTSQYLPLQDTLFNAFQNRQSIFSPSVQASGSPDAAFSSPFGQEGLGGGLRWSYDPNWMTAAPRPAAVSAYRTPTLTDTLMGGGHRGPEVHGGPAQPPVEFNPNPVLPPAGTPPPPRNGNGHWEWGWDPENPGQGVWKWFQDGPANRERLNKVY